MMTKMKPGRCFSKKWPCQTLRPVSQFLNRMHPEGIHVRTVANKLGMSPQSFSAYFQNDNMHLSKAEAIAAAYGCRLVLEYRYEGEYPDAGGKAEIHVPEEVGNLAGIEEYRQRMGLSIKGLADRCGCNRATITNALRRGDIMLDMLAEITNGLNLNVDWHWTPICKS